MKEISILGSDQQLNLRLVIDFVERYNKQDKEKEVAQAVSELSTILETSNEQYIEDNIETLQDYFMENDDMGMQCNKDNIEDYFSSWLENQDLADLIEIIDDREVEEIPQFKGTLASLEKLTIQK
mgnify:FL=1